MENLSTFLFSTFQQFSHTNIRTMAVNLDQALFSQSTGKTVLITGAARGIGAATVRQFNNHGANVILADLTPLKDAAEEVIRTLAHPDRAIFISVNIVNWAELTACFEEAITKFGSVDIVIANAGIMESHPVLDLDAVDENGRLLENEEAGRVIDVNLKGTLNSKSS
jgi:NAD(P)-dependent dehydrogenase (short-subunit alcohol dehydrogenase family)